jgi:hypothetical protein
MGIYYLPRLRRVADFIKDLEITFDTELDDLTEGTIALCRIAIVNRGTSGRVHAWTVRHGTNHNVFDWVGALDKIWANYDSKIVRVHFVKRGTK